MPEKLTDIIVCDACRTKNRKGITHCKSCGNELRRDFYRGLWLKNILITISLFFVPFIILYYITNFEIGTHFENQVKQGLEYSVDINTRMIKSFLAERHTDLLSIAKVNIYDLEKIETQAPFLRRYVIEKTWFDFIAVADRKGSIVFSTNNIYGSISGKEYFEKSMTGNFHNSGIFHSKILDTTAMIISTPLINRNDQIIGVIFASICLKTLYDLILDLRIGETSEIFMVDDQGIFLSPSRLGGKVLTEYGHYHGEPNPHTGERGILVHKDYRGEKVICAYQKFVDIHGYFVSEIDVDEAIAPVVRLKNVMFIIFTIFGCFLILSSIIFSRQVTNALKTMTRNLKSAFDDISQKKDTINTINVELRERLHDCESLSQQLRTSEEYIKNIIDSISSGLIAIDSNLHVTYYNENIKLLNQGDDIKINSNLFKELPMLYQTDIRSCIEQLFITKQDFYINKVQVSRKGNPLILSIAGFQIPHNDMAAGATLLINDITKQEHLNEQMADYEKLSALSQLALGAAHEINNPLLGITSYMELLIEEEIDVEKKTRAKEVLESAYRISETVRGLLNFARPNPPKFTKISINKIISETLSFLMHQPLFKKTKINEVLSDAVPQITADVNQIRQVLINIFLNAAQAMPDGGKLTVCTEKVKSKELVEIRVTDTGKGISKTDIKKVFDPFFTTKRGEGTGLGLSISYSYIKSHNGRITIHSKSGKGTEVIIILPIRQKQTIQAEVIE
ncbi:MAG: ATP-binding protein [bacterium]